MKRFVYQNFILICLVLFLASSCVSTKIITIEIPQKAQKELPDRIQSLAIVNRTVDENYTDIESDSIQNIFYLQNYDVDTFIYDLQAVDTMLMALGELLFESGRYDYVIPENRFVEAEKNAFYSQAMPWSEVKEICETYNTDAVLSVDMYNARVVTAYSKDRYADETSVGFVSISTAQMVIVYDVLINVYDPYEEIMLAREFFKDTLLWEDAANSANNLFKRFTPVKQGLSEASVAVALDFSDKISTLWQQERRPLYIKGDSNLKHAGTLVDNAEWEQAVALWKETAENTKSKSTKSKAQFNIAIAYEISGDIDNAINWALDSYNTMYHQITYQYLELLERRKKEIQRQNK
jgi:hypothetical protein